MEKIAVANANTPKNRTLSMVLSFTRKRMTIGFIMLFFSIFLFFGTYLFSDNDSDIDDEIYETKNSQSSTNTTPQQADHHVIQETEAKVSLKKKIFIGIMTYRNEASDIGAIIDTWVPRISRKIFCDGIHFISDVPIYVNLYDSVLIKTMYVRTEEEKYFMKFVKSLEKFTNVSRALWYVMTPINSYLNPKGTSRFVDLLSGFDPMKEEKIFALCTSKQSCFYAISRLATKSLLEVSTNITEFGKKLQEKSEPFPFPGIIHSNITISPDMKMFWDHSYADARKCQTDQEKILKLSDSFAFIYETLKDSNMPPLLEGGIRNFGHGYISEVNGKVTLCVK
ncbi:hypothetical protein TVAG_153250 [Trichomonas vaginalis G3]|uniref:Uncharacterized protein n=1 Tax=Trichomonas vaginalis (strain ATCC PRA-98 / G3) TaxID=412133 RepID=A2FYX9_TRIV3|nr:hypothetical protein TVAGG3_0521130 [Trichomonas vaginalis G3]EAX89880.1 hypothetical protein TVAG_153250 [Trichomonas vaginalis G3]KAI5518456.1 hypothetical protein TVAGG3_0521130 [Trichomonas vaginalis G3]|eukprot:XP_001302810.1 hypothetical protein [Trichomonas vaginalis G3]